MNMVFGERKRGAELAHKLAVITLVQGADFPTARSSLHSIAPQLSPRRRRFILANDALSDDLIEELRGLEETELIQPGRNLGVARGRNQLILAALEWGAELIVTVDDDLLVPHDYLDEVEGFMFDLSLHPMALPDIATPILLDYHAIAPELHSADETSMVEHGQAADFMTRLTSAEALAAWRRLIRPRQEQAVHHMGIRDWQRHYFAPLGRTSRQLRAAVADVVPGYDGGADPQRESNVRSDPQVIDALLSGTLSSLPIECAPGGSTVYRREVLESVGLLEEAFAPFGFEDAEFCIRVNRAGHQVALIPSATLLHDLQSRHKDRDPSVVTATRAKARSILIRQHCADGSEVASRAFDSMVLGLFEASMYRHARGGEIASVFAFLAGAINGLFARTTSPTLPTSDSSYSNGLIRLGQPTVSLVGDAVDGLIPRQLSGSVPFHLRTRRAAVARTLPPKLTGRADLTYELTEAGDLFVDRVRIEIPNLVTVELSAHLGGLSFGGEAEDPLDRMSISHLKLLIVDYGLKDQFENSRAWLGGWPSRGVMATLASSLPGREGAAIKRFLSPWGAPRQLVIEMTPGQRIRHRDIAAIDGGTWHIVRRLGLTVRLGEPVGSSLLVQEGAKS